MRHNEFIERVQQQADLSSSGDAERACRATLETLGECMGDWMPGAVAGNIAAQLPPGIGEHLRRTVAHPGRGDGGRLGRGDFIPRVAARAGVDNAQATYIAHAVIDAMFAATEGGMMAEVTEVLPPDLREWVTPGSSGLTPGTSGQARG
jgi:uncharacterized protein (DUF2267 family)